MFIETSAKAGHNVKQVRPLLLLCPCLTKPRLLLDVVYTTMHLRACLQHSYP